MKTIHLLKTATLPAIIFVIGAMAMPGIARAGDKVASKRRFSQRSATAAAHAAAKGDLLLEALLTELDRSTATLKMDQVQRPYYLEYRVHDVEDFNTEAAFGALREDQRAHFACYAWWCDWEITSKTAFITKEWEARRF